MVIVAAVDRSESTDRIVTQGRKLAEAFTGELHVVHVLSRGELRDIERASFETSGEAVEMERIKEVAREIARESAADIAPDATAVGLVGEAAEEVTDYASDHDAEYIVVGGRKLTPVGKAIFGSTTQSILLEADCPVVATLRS
ncbi:universal stress protein [Natronomonas sp. F2-12]|uniref:Universal stress protein n=1 Tax=Natronomonas aquatica TaxID=2841590 RepID=A0A9R1CTM6_9EURY|nr:universal stress protein [Natronomonas aquatica]MCQ4333361.1 universal stress protein [Natronomonas aquatica]